MTAEHQGWVKSWNGVCRKTEGELKRWAWKKVKNGIEVARRQRSQKIARATIAAKRGTKREHLSLKARCVAAFVCSKLAVAGHDFDFKIECSPDGVVYAFVKINELKPVRPNIRLVA